MTRTTKAYEMGKMLAVEFEERTGMEAMAWGRSNWGRAQIMAMDGELSSSLPHPESHDEIMAARMGFEGRELREVAGWRYGRIPAGGRSFNYRDQQWEMGLSMMALDGAEESSLAMAITAACSSERPRIRCRGILLPWRGSDGEPLLIFAEEE